MKKFDSEKYNQLFDDKLTNCGLQNMINTGSYEATLFLAFKYFENKDYVQSLPLFKKVARDTEISLARYMCACACANGQGCAVDYDLAVYFYFLIVFTGDSRIEDAADAAMDLSVCYSKGLCVGHDADSCTLWMQVSADMGSEKAKSVIALSKIVGQGEIKVDMKYLYSKAEPVVNKLHQKASIWLSL
jgi:TPR repeat protein